MDIGYICFKDGRRLLVLTPTTMEEVEALNLIDWTKGSTKDMIHLSKGDLISPDLFHIATRTMGCFCAAYFELPEEVKTNRVEFLEVNPRLLVDSRI
jgi:hypothetical protein